VTIVVAVLAYSLLKSTANKGSGSVVVRARLSDVRSLPVGAPVTVAGLPVGTIAARRVGAGYAEIDILFKSSVDLRENATLYKRRISLMARPSLEIDPGDSDKPLSGKYIERVVEGTQIGEVLEGVSDALPSVQSGAGEAMLRVEQLRARVNGPFTERVVALDKATADVGQRVHNRLGSIDSTLTRGETLDLDVRGTVRPQLSRIRRLSNKARDVARSAQEWVARTGPKSRASINEVDINWNKYSEPLVALDEGQEGFGSLLNSPQLHQDFVDATDDTRIYLRSLTTWQMRVGLKTEFGFNAGAPKGYVTVKAGRTNRFFYIELVGSPQGGSPEASVTYDAANDVWNRNVSITNELRITTQFASRVGPAILRFGFKESSFGIGADVDLIDDRLTLSADIFELGVGDLPRVKLAASYRMFSQLYLLAGLDDALNSPQTINTVGANDTNNLSEVHLGRDFFLGAGLQFSDRDLGMLLRIGGTALAAFAI